MTFDFEKAARKNIVNYESNIGTVGLVEVHREKRPNIRKPYEYVLSFEKCNNLVKELKAYAKTLSNLAHYNSVTFKPIKYGIKLDVFILTHQDQSCMDVKQWNKACEDIFLILKKYLGKDAMPYATPFVKAGKFTLVYDAYIMYELD